MREREVIPVLFHCRRRFCVRSAGDKLRPQYKVNRSHGAASLGHVLTPVLTNTLSWLFFNSHSVGWTVWCRRSPGCMRRFRGLSLRLLSHARQLTAWSKRPHRAEQTEGVESQQDGNGRQSQTCIHRNAAFTPHTLKGLSQNETTQYLLILWSSCHSSRTSQCVKFVLMLMSIKMLGQVIKTVSDFSFQGEKNVWLVLMTVKSLLDPGFGDNKQTELLVYYGAVLFH